MTDAPRTTVTFATKDINSKHNKNNKGGIFSILRKRPTIEIAQEMEDRPAIVEVTSANFDQIVINSEKDVLIEFYTQVQTAY